MSDTMTLDEGETMSLFLAIALATIAFLTARYLWIHVNSLISSASKPSLEQERDVQRRAAMAAQSRQQRSRPKTAVATRQASTKANETDMKVIHDSASDNVKEVPHQHDSSKEHTPTTDTPDASSKEQIRKGTLEDRVKWDEDRDSQFGGFNIYGHKTSGCQECGGHQLVQTSDDAITPSFSSGGTIHNIASIPHLPMADEAQRILQQLANEFEPVLKARAWTVLALTEMCCCGDGDETLARQTSRTQRHNTLGYCVSNGNGRTAAGIHIRLRPSCTNGSFFYPYQELVATMAHELAHIEIQNHSPKFYQVMADIERQRLEYLSRGIILDDGGFPLADMGHRLNPSNHEVIGSRELKRKVAESAQQRQENRGTQKQKVQVPPVVAPQKPTTKPKPKRSRTESYKRRVQLQAVEKRLGLFDVKTE